MNQSMYLVTKLTQPRTSRWHLPRPHLHSILADGLTRRLTALIAAAGHGKTCTLAYFLTEAQIPYLWIQLDPGDSEIRTFAHYLSEGIRTELAGGSRALTALDAGGASPQLMPLFVADLEECPNPVAIVLDDFHLIDRDSPVVQLVAGLLQHASDKVHFFICSRTALPFSTARLKVIQEAAEITEDDLRFTPGEVLTFMREMAGITLDEHHLEQISHLTEGWSAALVLLASGLKRRGSVESFIGGTLPADLFSYLADEVFHSLPASVQGFMEESAILDVCSPQACDAILERRDSGSVLAQLLNSNLLLTQLGPDSFRYHHLLQRFLLERLKVRDSAETFRRLHKRAGDWYISRELPEEGVRYYLRGGWLQEAAGLVEDLAPLWLRTNKLERLRGLLAVLPTETKEPFPWISLCEARQAVNAGNPDVAMGMARLALRAFQERGDARGLVQANTLIGEICIVRQQYSEGMAAYEEAAKALQPEHRYEEGVLLQRRSVLQFYLQGASTAVEADLRRALAIYVEVGDLLGEAAVSDQIGQMRAALGDYASGISFLEHSVEILRSLGEPPYEVGTNLAWLYNVVGRFRDAVAISEPILASSSRKLRRAYAAAHLVYAYTHLGEFSKATAMTQTSNALIEELGNREMKSELAVDLSTLYRLSGQPQAAVPYANEAMQTAKQTERANFHTRPVIETALLHLFHTGNAAAAARMAEKALARLTSDESHPYERLMLMLTIAVAEFRQSRTESRPDGVRILQEGLSECSRRGYQFFALQEWPLALAIAIYGLAYGVHNELILGIVRLMNERLPTEVLQGGIPLMEAEARLVPAAWQALPDEAVREAFSRLLTPGDRRRVVNLAKGPAPMRIQCLGNLAVTIGAEQLDLKALRKRKSGQLLVLLLSQDSPLPRDQVMDRLWPDLDPEAADTSLRVSLHHLRRLLEPHLGGRSRSRYIQSEGGLIWFSRQPEVSVDLDQFREALGRAVDAAEGSNRAVAVQHYEQASKVYRGDLSTDDPYSSPLEELRTALREQYTSVLDWLGGYYWHEAQDPAKAILAFKQRLTLDAAHEAAHQALMRIYLENGQVGAARQQYSTCREALANGLGVTPSRATESLLQLALSMESEASPPAQVVKQRASRPR